jgi:hypothetical protein
LLVFDLALVGVPLLLSHCADQDPCGSCAELAGPQAAWKVVLIMEDVGRNLSLHFGADAARKLMVD